MLIKIKIKKNYDTSKWYAEVLKYNKTKNRVNIQQIKWIKKKKKEIRQMWVSHYDVTFS